MNTEDAKPLSSEESLAIISQMINTAKGNVQSQSFYFLLWGYIVMTGSLGHFFLGYYELTEAPYMAWLVTIPAVIASFIYGARQQKRARVRTSYDRLAAVLWIGFLVMIATMQVFMSQLALVFVPLTLMMSGHATFLTGYFIKFKPLMYGGVILWVCAVVAFIVPYDMGLIVQAIAVLIGYLIPGHLLRAKPKA